MSEALRATTELAASDADLLDRTTLAVSEAGAVLRERFGQVVRHRTREELMHALAANDDAVLAVLRPRLTALRPNAGWVEDELDGGALPPGEWWVVDPAEGNVNHLHALPDWAVTATLVRENRPVLTVVHLPLTGETYTALAGAGAHLDGKPLRVSRTAALGLGIVATSQARPDEDAEVVRRIGSSITAMLFDALVVRTAVPATSTWRTWPPGGSTPSGSSPAPARTCCPERCSSPRPADGSPTPMGALDPAERKLPGRRTGCPRRGRRHALALTPQRPAPRNDAHAYASTHALRSRSS